MSSSMSESVRAVILRVIDREGGITNDVVDRGGFTNLGITKPYLSRYLGRPATDHDIGRLTVEKSIDVYWRNTWIGERLDRLFKYPLLQEAVFDWCVNSGDNTGTMSLQRLVGVKADGEIGPKTIAAVDKYISDRNPMGEEKAVNDLLVYRIEKYCRIVQNDPTQVKFIWGWINRALHQLKFNLG